jgi:selenide,water dikinase
LAQVLRPLQEIYHPQDYPNLLIGLDWPDDAAVWQLEADRALVATTDFFTPVVDDAYDYGAIAAANSLSDVYAMGGKPFLALNIAAFPPDLPPEITSEILRGGAEKVRQAGVVIAGGHTIQDKEPKYGLVVLGFVRPDQMLTKSGAKPGDKLVLTKPLGFGVTTTALKQDKALPEDVAEVVKWMGKLNSDASQLAVQSGLHSATDVTGFGLTGHAMEIADASGVCIQLDFKSIPFFDFSLRYARQGTFPGGAFDNKHYFGEKVHFTVQISEPEQMLLFDPQTSGGLLLIVPPDTLPSFQKHAQEINQSFWVIGDVVQGAGIIVV